MDYLRKNGITVALHGNYINNSVFLQYNYHQNPYCHYVKSVYGKWNECICRQEKVIAARKNGTFFGCCYAGVGEFVYPVFHNSEPQCFISVSGYTADCTIEKATHFAQKNGLDKKEIRALAYKYLNPDVPKREAVDAIIEPLVFMLESYFTREREKDKDETLLYHQMLRYITENCHNRLTMQDLSRHFHYSVSTLSHLFLKNSGKSLPAYMDDLRLSEAQWYLSNSNTAIT